jgi:hypothetical protein
MPKLNPEHRIDTKAGFAARVGVTKGRISQLIDLGLPVRADGRIDVNAGLSWIENSLDPARRNKGGAPAVIGKSATLAEARRLHEIVKVQRAKLAFEREKGLLIDAGAAERTVYARAKAERDAHIAWVQRSAPVIAAELGVETGLAFAVLDRLMREHLEHLAATPLGGLFHADGD